MKVLFKDIDGVLNREGYDAEVPHDLLLGVHNQMRRFRRDDVHRRLKWLLPEAVERVNRILDASGAKLVISSTWRLTTTQEEIQILLGARGLTHTIFSMTPELPRKMSEIVPRGKEIGAWLQANPGVTSFVILDDCGVEPYSAQHVWVDPWVAITDDNVKRALEILGV
jgi:hypothetical protein